MKKAVVLILAAVMAVSMLACGAPAQEEKVDLKALYAACTGEMTPMMEVDGDMRRDFMGIAEEDCAQVYTAFAEDGLRTDELWLIEAKDPEAFKRLKALAENRMQAKLEETESYSPEQYEVVKKGLILENGLYLAFLVAPDGETLQEHWKAAFEK